MTLFLLPSPNTSATAALPDRPPADAAPEAVAVVAWARHVAAGRIGGPVVPPAAPPPGTDPRLASLEAILGRRPAGGAL